MVMTQTPMTARDRTRSTADRSAVAGLLCTTAWTPVEPAPSAPAGRVALPAGILGRPVHVPTGTTSGARPRGTPSV